MKISMENIEGKLKRLKKTKNSNFIKDKFYICVLFIIRIMKKIILIIILLAILIFAVGYPKFTGKVVENEGYQGPSAEDMECMIQCTTQECDVDDMDCRMAKSEECGKQCGVETERPEPADESEVCMQECISKGCDEFDVACKQKNVESCEEECNMMGDTPNESEMSEEQLCISKCVVAEDPSVICGNSQEGETGGALCQRCATECVHLYEGPCLNDEQLTEKENVCISMCEHCYGEPIEGPSGQGWNCIIDVECKDASSEFGDEPGEGPGIGQEGYVANSEETLETSLNEETVITENIFEEIGNFFKGLFGGAETRK